MIPILFVLFVTAIVVVSFVTFTIKKLFYVSNPNEALIFSGFKRMSAGRQVGYRVVRGGRALRVPFFERVDRVDLTNLAIDVSVVSAYSKGGIPLNVQGVANVKLPGEEPLLNNAIERFMGRSRDDIIRVAKETLEGNLRGVLAQLTPEQVNEDKARFAQILLEEAEHDLHRMGLVLDTLKIQNVSDEVGYLNSIGRVRGAKVRMEATIAEAKAQADASEQQAANWSRAEAAKIEAELAITQQEMQKRIADAQTRREAMIEEARGEVAAEIAQVKAEIERQKARALQVKRRLDADVVQPAEADRRAKEEAARGAAAAIVERGKAEAESLRKLVDAFRKAGPAGREVLTLQKLLPLVSEIAGASYDTSVARVSVLPKSEGKGDSVAKTLINASTQVQAATGVDLLGATAHRLASSRQPTREGVQAKK